MYKILKLYVALVAWVFVVSGCVGQETVSVPTASPTVIQTVTATTQANERATTPSLTATPRATATPEPVHRQPAMVLRGHTGPVTLLAWSPDGNLLASASGGFEAFQSSDLAIRLWAADGKLQATLAGHTKPVSALAWSPDGQTLASSSYDGTAKLWNAGGELQKSLGGTESLHNVAWSPDGKMLATGGIIGGVASITTPVAGCCVTLPGVVRLWRPDGTLAMTLGTQFTGGKFLNLAWSPDGTLLAAGATDYRIWRADGTLLGSTPGCNSCTPAWGMTWSPDSQTLATGNENGELFLYDTSSNRTGSFRYAGGINEIRYAPNGAILAIGSPMHSVQLLRAADLQSLGFVTTPARPPVRWSPDGALLATANITSLARIFRASGEEIMTLDGCAGVVRALAWSRDGRTLAAGTDAHLVCLWAISSS